jgi:hypothetical protein
MVKWCNGVALPELPYFVAFARAPAIRMISESTGMKVMNEPLEQCITGSRSAVDAQGFSECSLST